MMTRFYMVVWFIVMRALEIILLVAKPCAFSVPKTICVHSLVILIVQASFPWWRQNLGIPKGRSHNVCDLPTQVP